MLAHVVFFKLMAIPMLTAFAVAFPGWQLLMDGMMADYAHWAAAEEHQMPAAKGSSSIPSSPSQLTTVLS
jgi:hypothetical protein